MKTLIAKLRAAHSRLLSKHRFEPGDLDSLNGLHGFQTETIKWLLAQLPGQPKRVLEVGACDGYIKRLFPESLYVGIGTAPENREVVACSLQTFVLNARQSMPGLGYYFDLVVFCQSLEHMPNPDEQIGMARESLRFGGHLFVAVPDASTPWASDYEGHCTLFNQKILERMLRRNGFEVVTIEHHTFRRDCREVWALGKRKL